MPSSRARRARRLMESIQATVNERHEAWAEGGHPNLTQHATRELTALHQDKRVMRREVYNAAPYLEGRPTFRNAPKAGG